MDKKPQRIAKETEVSRLQELFNNAEVAILADYRGLTVAQDVKLRAKMRDGGVDYMVAKNTLIKLACHQNEQQGLDAFLEGPTAVAFGQDPVATAKLLSSYFKEVKKGQIKVGLLGDKVITAADVDALAKLPAREVLLAQVVGMIQAPLANFAGVTSGMLRQLVTVVDKVREQKAAAEA